MLPVSIDSCSNSICFESVIPRIVLIWLISIYSSSFDRMACSRKLSASLKLPSDISAILLIADSEILTFSSLAICSSLWKISLLSIFLKSNL